MPLWLYMFNIYGCFSISHLFGISFYHHYTVFYPLCISYCTVSCRSFTFALFISSTACRQTCHFWVYAAFFYTVFNTAVARALTVIKLLCCCKFWPNNHSIKQTMLHRRHLTSSCKTTSVLICLTGRLFALMMKVSLTALWLPHPLLIEVLCTLFEYYTISLNLKNLINSWHLILLYLTCHSFQSFQIFISYNYCAKL